MKQKIHQVSEIPMHGLFLALLAKTEHFFKQNFLYAWHMKKTTCISLFKTLFKFNSKLIAVSYGITIPGWGAWLIY